MNLIQLPKWPPRKVGVQHNAVAGPARAIEDNPFSAAFVADERYGIAWQLIRHLVSRVDLTDHSPAPKG